MVPLSVQMIWLRFTAAAEATGSASPAAGCHGSRAHPSATQHPGSPGSPGSRAGLSIMGNDSLAKIAATG